MKRLELFEFEDFDWLPNVIRSSITSLIVVLHKMMGTADVISDLISDVDERHPITQVVDMGSGSGGPMIDVIKNINNRKGHTNINLVLSDLYPNPATVEKINSQQIPNVRYHASSIDATNLSDTPVGLKTMVASFHHMNPDAAKQILQSAQLNKEPILIYEIAENNVPVWLWWLLLPLSLLILVVMSLVMTPFTNSITLPQIFFTYLIPIIPIVYAWDGQASLMRTYTFEDVRSLIGDANDESYEWTIESAKKSNGKKQGYYIMGIPNI